MNGADLLTLLASSFFVLLAILAVAIVFIAIDDRRVRRHCHELEEQLAAAYRRSPQP